MRRRGRLVSATIIALALVSGLFLPVSVRANITSCADSQITPHAVAPDSNSTFTVSIRNTDVNEVAWVDIDRPTGLLEITGADFPEWDVEFTAERVSLRGTSIGNGQLVTGTISAHAANATISNTNWLVRVSDEFEGANAFYCSGSLGFAISGNLQDETPPSFSNIRLANLTSSSITILWDTDEPASSILNYGETDSLGSTKASQSLTREHSVTLPNLRANTGYFFEVSGADVEGNIGYGDSGTFLTALASTSSSVPNTASTVGSVNSTVSVQPGKELVVPTIVITTHLAGPYKAVPEMSGLASDNSGLAKIEYSTDNGVTWQGVGQVRGLGGRRATFSFTPILTEDGDYQIKVRAIDTALNVGLSEAQTLVIDTGPPVVGGAVLMIGAHELSPSKGQVITSVVGLSQRLTLNATGGPTTVTLTAEKVGKAGPGAAKQHFTMTRSSQTGLWNGVINFKEVGSYNLVADSVDGAGNTAVRPIATLSVLDTGKIVDSLDRRAVKDATVTLYVLEPSSGSWQVWDGSGYGQQNPQRTGADGRYSLFVPNGTYYLQVRQSGYRSAVSQIFNLTAPAPITTQVNLVKRIHLSLGQLSFSLPAVASKAFRVKDAAVSLSRSGSDIKLPQFELVSTDGETVRDVNLLGRPTVLTLLTTWAPGAQEQLPILDDVAASYHEVGVEPVFLLESAAKLAVYRSIGGYRLPLISDRAGVLAKNLPITFAPTHYFINRKGVIKNVVVGVLSKEELFNELSKL